MSTKVWANIIPMPVDMSFKTISVHVSPGVREQFIITGITEKENAAIKRSENIDITRGEFKFHITPDDILCFGDIDFSDGSEDLKELDTFNWLEHLGMKGVTIPGNYDYEEHTCYSNKSVIMHRETFRNSVLCQYLHGCLGKPKYTLIFRRLS